MPTMASHLLYVFIYSAMLTHTLLTSPTCQILCKPASFATWGYLQKRKCPSSQHCNLPLGTQHSFPKPTPSWLPDRLAQSNFVSAISFTSQTGRAPYSEARLDLCSFRAKTSVFYEHPVFTENLIISKRIAASISLAALWSTEIFEG